MGRESDRFHEEPGGTRFFGENKRPGNVKKTGRLQTNDGKCGRDKGRQEVSQGVIGQVQNVRTART